MEMFDEVIETTNKPEQYQADKRLWLLFVGADRSRRSNLMYCEYRKMLLFGGKLRAHA